MKVSNKKILVTGGAGFIGSYICKRLLIDGAEVVVLDNFSTGKIDNLKEIKDQITVIKGDIRNIKDVMMATENCDVVVHEAFPYGAHTREVDTQFVDSGAIGTSNVLRASLERDVKKVIYASSVAVYGQQKYLPMDEDHPKDPFLPYGATKYVGELYCSTFYKVYGLNTVSLRYFNVYGPKYATFDHSAMIYFLEGIIKDKPPLIYGDGTQVRDYTYINDAVEGTMLAIKKDVAGKGDVFNIGEGKGTQIIDLARKIIKMSGKDFEPLFARLDEYRHIKQGLPYGVTKKINGGYLDTRNYIADISRAKRMLGYNPCTNLDDGIKATLEWMINNVKMEK